MLNNDAGGRQGAVPQATGRCSGDGDLRDEQASLTSAAIKDNVEILDQGGDTRQGT